MPDEQLSLGDVPDNHEEDTAVGPLPDPSRNTVGKFHGPAAGAPETQREAAILVYPRTGIARERVLRRIKEAGELGVTDEEGITALRISPNTYRPRRVELVEDEWIEDSGIRRATFSGDKAVAWVLTRRGREHPRWAEADA